MKKRLFLIIECSEEWPTGVRWVMKTEVILWHILEIYLKQWLWCIPLPFSSLSCFSCCMEQGASLDQEGKRKPLWGRCRELSWKELWVPDNTSLCSFRVALLLDQRPSPNWYVSWFYQEKCEQYKKIGNASSLQGKIGRDNARAKKKKKLFQIAHIFLTFLFWDNYLRSSHATFFSNNFTLFIWGCAGSLLLHGLSLIVESGNYTLVEKYVSFSLWWFLLLLSTGSREQGLHSCSSWALEHRLSTCGTQA